MPTTRYYPRVSHTNLGDALPEIVRFLIDDHATHTGPGWTIVEARSNSSREVPSTASDLDSLSSATDWKNGSISTGDWIVLESADANNSNHFQVFLKYNSATQLQIQLIPLEDFTTGGGDTASPTLPATAVGAGGSAVTMSFDTGAYFWHIVADEGMCYILADNGDPLDARHIYFGEVDGANTGGSPTDDRAYVILDETTAVQVDDANITPWNRLSPVDDSTILDEGSWTWVGRTFSSIPQLASSLNALGNNYILPIYMVFLDSGHSHIAGILRNVYSGHKGLGTIGTLDSLNYGFYNDITGTDITIVFKWDGSTAL